MRDWLSLLRLLKWESREYAVGWHDGAGQYHKGQAARWRFGEELMQMLAESTKDHHAGGNNVQGRADEFTLKAPGERKRVQRLQQ